MEGRPTRQRLRKRTHEILEAARAGDRTSRIVDVAIIALVSSNVLAVVLESVSSLGERWHAHFWVFDRVSVALFTVEYALRLWSCVEAGRGAPAWKVRLRFAMSPALVVDLLAIAPVYLAMLFSPDLQLLRVLRLLRVLKLTRYWSALNLVLSVFRKEARAFGAALFLMLMVMILAASGIYLTEHHIQAQAFGSIPAAMWWAVATLTTVGYGDVTPVTPAGKVFGALITIVGVAMVALPAGLLASGFQAELQARRQAFRREAAHALEDGVLDPRECLDLETLRRRLGVDEEEAAEILEWMQAAAPSRPCPHCGRSLSEKPSPGA